MGAQNLSSAAPRRAILCAMDTKARRAWLGFGAAVLVLASPLKALWMQSSLGWAAPFALWLALIVVAAWQSRW